MAAHEIVLRRKRGSSWGPFTQGWYAVRALMHPLKGWDWVPELSTRERKFLRLGLSFAGLIALCVLITHFGKPYAKWAWGSLRVVNFLVNLTPTMLSIVFAFVVDKDLQATKQKAWRASIVLCGIAWSSLLWHQEVLNDKASEVANKQLLADAQKAADAHSDQSIAKVQKDLTGLSGTVKDLGGQVQGVGKQLGTQLTTEFTQATNDLGAKIGTVGKPVPTPTARLTFSLWDESFATTGTPLLKQALMPDANGNYSIAFSFENTSETTAEEIDTWISICRVCTYVEVPLGYAKPQGSEEQTRLKHFSSLNPGVSQEKQVVLVHVPPSGYSFQIGFVYSCKTCGPKAGLQSALIIMPIHATPRFSSESYTPAPGPQ